MGLPVGQTNGHLGRSRVRTAGRRVGQLAHSILTRGSGGEPKDSKQGDDDFRDDGGDAPALAYSPATPAASAQADPRTAPATRTILVVEDDPDAREMMTLVLSTAGYDVTTARDGSAAIEAAARRHFDLVVTDIAMPRMDGIELARLLRRTRPNAGTPVIALTGQAVADVPAQAMAAGCDAVLSKPCYPDYLLSVVEQLLNGAFHRQTGVVGGLGPGSAED